MEEVAFCFVKIMLTLVNHAASSNDQLSTNIKKIYDYQLLKIVFSILIKKAKLAKANLTSTVIVNRVKN